MFLGKCWEKTRGYMRCERKRGLTLLQALWLANTTLSVPPHDETWWLVLALFGQNEFAQLGSLQAVRRAVVHDGDGFLALEQGVAV